MSLPGDKKKWSCWISVASANPAVATQVIDASRRAGEWSVRHAAKARANGIYRLGKRRSELIVFPDAQAGITEAKVGTKGANPRRRQHGPLPPKDQAVAFSGFESG